MPDTITTYNVFAAATKARASEVNTNFSNYRGTILPINTDTATASDLSHNLGSTDHRWSNAYVDNLLLSGDTTSGISIGSTSTGRMILSTNNTKAAECTENGYFIPNKNYAESTASTTKVTTGAYTTIAQVTLTTDGGWLAFEFVPSGSLFSTFGLSINPLSGSYNLGMDLRVLRDNTSTGTTTTMYSVRYQHNLDHTSTATQPNSLILAIPSGYFNQSVNTNITAGSYVYDLQIKNVAIPGSANASNTIFRAREF